MWSCLTWLGLVNHCEIRWSNWPDRSGFASQSTAPPIAILRKTIAIAFGTSSCGEIDTEQFQQ